MSPIIKLLNSLSSLVSSYSYQLSGRAKPTKSEVIRELHKILKNDPFFKSQDTSMVLNNEWLNSFLKNLAKFLRDPLVIVLLIAVLCGVYFLIRSLAPYIQSNSLHSFSHSSKEKKDPRLNSFLSLYQLALDQSRSKLYRQALISLHKATVEYLVTEIIISSPYKNYTNNDLKRKLKPNQRFYQPFCEITRYAEIAGFSAIEVKQSDFNQALEVFERCFLL